MNFLMLDFGHARVGGSFEYGSEPELAGWAPVFTPMIIEFGDTLRQKRTDEVNRMLALAGGASVMHFDEKEARELYHSCRIREDYFELSSTPITIPLGRGSNGSIPLVPGVTTLFSLRGGGKTVLSDYVAAYLADEYPDEGVSLIKFGEPEALSRSNRSTISSDTEMMVELCRELLGKSRVIIIDSFKQLIFQKSGNTGSGGVNLQLLSVVSQLSIIAERLGKTILIAWNPQTSKEEVITEWLNQIESSVTSVFYIHTPTVDNPLAKPGSSRRKASFVSRKTEDRNVQTIEFDIKALVAYVDAASKVSLESDSETEIDESSLHTVSAVNMKQPIFPRR